MNAGQTVRTGEAGADPTRRAIVVRWPRDITTILGRTFTWDGKTLDPVGDAPAVVDQCAK